MAVRYAQIRPASSGFGMYQAGPESTLFGTESGEFKAESPEVQDAEMSDFLDWLSEYGEVITDGSEVDEYDGNTYDQSGMIVIVTSDDTSIVYCATEV